MHHMLCICPSAALRASEGLVALAQAHQPSQRPAAHAYSGLALMLAAQPAGALPHFEQTLALEPEPITPPLLNLHTSAEVQRLR
jgi:hypothetical protein